MRELSKSVEELLKKTDFFHFDQFIIEKMLERKVIPEEITTKMRNQAYHTCLANMGSDRVAAIQTMQKWFGIHGRTTPSREMIFHLGFSLRLTTDEVREYLIKGLHEPDFQVNDYREVLFMYGYENRLTYEDVLGLVEKFESMLPPELEIHQHNHTADMMEAYRVNCHLPEEDFLLWMIENASEFKGYSKTILNYFRVYKEEILLGVKEEAESELEELLSQTTFYHWEKKWLRDVFGKNSQENKQKRIEKYIVKEMRSESSCISEDMEKKIREVLEMAFLSPQSNQELLAELYAAVNKKVRNYKTNNKNDLQKRRLPLDITLMNDKYISDLLNVAIQKERQIQLDIVKSYLGKWEEKELCPDWMEKQLVSCKYQGDIQDKKAVETWVSDKLREQKRRCHLIHRGDLLPLILCVAQRRYLEKYNIEDGINTDEAKREFVELANETLSACHMELLQPDKYELDAVLMECYQKDELCYLSEVLEELVK